ncbi:hypothetical protein Tsp_14509 [Trichinella spiralis]|uniref:hypothetical protein n=1 Tax=Trichinella spiralis TaxID=6334 RepID=UPI0001EFEF9C|nr:hypothetical protein Tsp_14509 [Trichinella spiralis]
MKWVDQFNLWKEKRRAKFEGSHLTEDATSSINVVESERNSLKMFSVKKVTD